MKTFPLMYSLCWLQLEPCSLSVRVKSSKFKVQFSAWMHDSLQHPPESATGSIALNLWDFISYDMKGVVSVWHQTPLKFLTLCCMHVSHCCCSGIAQVISSMTLPFASTDVVFRSFKVMPRAEVRCVAGNIVLAA